MTTLKDVLALEHYTGDEYLCPIANNTYGLQFLSFRIRDAETREVFFEIAPDVGDWDEIPRIQVPTLEEEQELGDNSARFMQYFFGPSFLRCKRIETSLVFRVGEEGLTNYRMVERHYFRDKLLRSFDFHFGFCIPNSVNSWDMIYEVPDLDEETIADMTANPFEVKSDSFYFEEDHLIMHNKSEYSYED